MKWISINERLPKINQRVLVFNKQLFYDSIPREEQQYNIDAEEESLCVARFQGEFECSLWDGTDKEYPESVWMIAEKDNGNYQAFTHWMEIPNPPEK